MAPSHSAETAGLAAAGLTAVTIAIVVVVESHSEDKTVWQIALQCLLTLGAFALLLVALVVAMWCLMGVGRAIGTLLEHRRSSGITRRGPDYVPAPITYPFRWRRAKLEVEGNGTLRRLGRQNPEEVSLVDCVKISADVDFDGVGIYPYFILVDRRGREFGLGPGEVANDAFRRALLDFCPVADVRDPDLRCTPLELIAGTPNEAEGKIEAARRGRRVG